MGCKKTTVKIAKRVGAEVGAVLLRKAVGAVTAVETLAREDPDWWASRSKRDAVADYLRIEAKATGQELQRRVANLVVEFAVEAVKGPDDESEIGIDDLATTEIV